MLMNRSARRSAADRSLRLAGIVAGFLLLSACGGGDPPSAHQNGSEESQSSRAPFLRDVTAVSGIDFVHRVTADGRYRLPEVLGAGCAIFDANGDGALDLYFIDTGDAPEAGAANRLFLRQPDGTYVDATESSGLGDTGFGIGVAVADIDNDGDQDVFVGNWGEDRLYRNDGAGVFTDITAAAGLGGSLLTSSVGFLDFDRDGFLDLFVLHYTVPDPHQACRGKGDGREYCSPQAYRHCPDTVYRNRGDGTFEDVSLATGVGEVAAAGLGLGVMDFDGDGWPDVYVANDQVANQLWINQHDGTFRNEAMAHGVAYNGQAVAESSMGVVVADLNQDGRPDILCSHIAGETNTLYLSDGATAFVDATDITTPGRPSFGLTGWGMAFLDIEHDGDLDLIVANGAVDRRAGHAVGSGGTDWSGYAEPNQLFVNAGSPAFSESAALGGDFCSAVEVSRGVATGDLDGDGDVDVVVTNIAGPARVYENVAPKVGHWLRVRAVDPALSRAAIGATVVVADAGRRYSATVGAASSYLSTSDGAAHFGLPADAAPSELDVRWPSGEWERFPLAGIDRNVVVIRGTGKLPR